jgi:manganese-dependent inorganic pyrophosphatase
LSFDFKYEVITLSKKHIFVTGHKSPDTDSICSSIAYARLKQLMNIDAVAIRGGEINKETEFALDYFKVPVQPLVKSFYITVGEAVDTSVPALPLQASLKDAAQWFDANDLPFAPVADGKTFSGILDKTVFADEFINNILGRELGTVASLVADPAVMYKGSDLAHDVKDGVHVVVEDGQYMGVISRAALDKVEKQQVILVDHNEKKQIIDGIEEAEIIENIDHHRIGGDISTEGPIFILVKPVGCTGTIVTQLYQQNQVAIPLEIAGLLLSAIISDTVLFRSPTCTEQDKEAAAALAAIAGVKIEEYGMAMLKAGANVSDMSPDEIAHNDMKEFSENGQVISISQVQVMDTQDLLDQKDILLNAMEKMRAGAQYNGTFLMITSIIDESTNLLFAGNMDDVVNKAFSKEVISKEVYLPNVMSRKKQIRAAHFGCLERTSVICKS